MLMNMTHYRRKKKKNGQTHVLATENESIAHPFFVGLASLNITHIYFYSSFGVEVVPEHESLSVELSALPTFIKRLAELTHSIVKWCAV